MPIIFFYQKRGKKQAPRGISSWGFGSEYGTGKWEHPRNNSWPIAGTMDCNGVAQRSTVSGQGRVRAEFVFGNGTVGFCDFTGVSYHSRIRSRHFRIQAGGAAVRSRNQALEDCISPMRIADVSASLLRER